MVKCKICNNEIDSSETPYVVKGYSFHTKCFEEISETYKNSKMIQRLVKFAFRKF